MRKTSLTLILSAFQKEDGTKTVSLRVGRDRKKKEIKLVDIDPFFWDQASETVLKKKENKKYPEADKVNTKLADYKKKANKIIKDLEDIGEDYLLSDFVSQFDSDFNKDSFFDIAESYINKVIRGKETARSYKSYLTKLKQYKDKLSLVEVNRIDFMEKYNKYMQSIDNKPNTRHKSFAFFRSVLNYAVKKNLIKENNLLKYEDLKRVPTDKDFLDFGELEILEGLLEPGKLKNNQLKVLKMFLFSCYTGIRLGDMMERRYKDIYVVDHYNQETKSIERVKEIHFTMGKIESYTLEKMKIPLIKQASLLLDQNPLAEQFLFCDYAEQTIRKRLKEIIALTGINKKVTYHTSRHTAGTLIYTITQDLYVTSKILGHKSIKTTMQYAKMADMTKVNAMKKYEKRWGF